MSFTVKYASKTWSDIVITNTSNRRTLDSYIYGNNHKPLLLYGDYGVGKTTVAKLLPDAIEGKTAEVIYKRATEFSSIQDVTVEFNESVGFYQFFSVNNQKRRYFITNELNITSKAAHAFRDVMDELQSYIQFIFTRAIKIGTIMNTENQLNHKQLKKIVTFASAFNPVNKNWFKVSEIAETKAEDYEESSS